MRSGLSSDSVKVYDVAGGKRKDVNKSIYGGSNHLPNITSKNHQMVVKFSAYSNSYYTRPKRGFEAIFSAVSEWYLYQNFVKSNVTGVISTASLGLGIQMYPGF